MLMDSTQKHKIVVTGSAGFIGYHLSNLLLKQGHEVMGVDALTDYYDQQLKIRRTQMLMQNEDFKFLEMRLEENDFLLKVPAFNPDIIIHLAAQAGVRYSIENPKEYVDTNLVGTFYVLELARICEVKHLLFASTSSIYGSNDTLPFKESDKTDHQLTFYAATKKANESMAHSYSHIWNIPSTGLRFFTVYGPWGRPDLALFKFVKAMLEGSKIDVYNYGNMTRDFTFVDDLVFAISQLIEKVPTVNDPCSKNDTLSKVAPYRTVNIGNSKQVLLLDFINEIEHQLNIKAKMNLMELQTGDVVSTHADISLLKDLVGPIPTTSIKHGVKQFVDWYRLYYQERGN
jgi:UDP-glucuronate 4-epimerase